jgi:RHS repeat-associated protein
VLVGYRWGFNGMEKDDDWQGEGNAYDFGARVYDSRLGRWMSVDAYESHFTDLSPFSSFMNSPISVLDPDGNYIIPQGRFRKIFGMYRAVLRVFTKTDSGSKIMDFYAGKKGYRTNGQESSHSHNTHLIFTTSPPDGTQQWPEAARRKDRKEWGETIMLIRLSDGNQIDMSQFNQEEHGSLLPESSEDIEISVLVHINPDKGHHRNLGRLSSTMLHELELHVRPLNDLIAKLRSGDISVQEFTEQYNVEKQRGGTLNVDDAHRRLASHQNSDKTPFAVFQDQVRKALPKVLKGEFDREVGDDVDNHKKRSSSNN